MLKKLLNFVAFIALTFSSATWGFSSTDQINKNPSTNAAAAAKTTAEKSVISPILNNLPEDYTDPRVKNFSPEQPVNNEVSLMQQQLDDLKNAYLHLKREMSERGPEKPAEDPRDHEAKRSGFSFAGLDSGVDKLVGPGSGDKLQRPELPVDDKMKIKNTDKANDVYDSHAMLKPASPYQLLAGTIIPASLVTAIDSTISGATVVAHITRNVYDTVTGKYLLIPRGSKAIGEYNSRSLAPGQSRVALEFNRIVRPDGSSIQMGKFAATDVQGSAGLEGEVDNHWGQVIGASVLGALIGYGAGMTSDRVGNNKDNRNKDYSGAQQNSINNAANSFNNVTQNIANRALNMPPTIKLPAGYQFNITVKKDMILTPYSD